MSRGLLKLAPEDDGVEEEAFDLRYYQSLSTADRFRMIIERSILLLQMASAHEADRKSSPLTKRS